ncbi:MAG: hypothetical protein DCC68_05345 [Planctomycetota bacterium]|nr:MAG: hypothetical protein DCC68_05345 [Planctomycetota bacterium]
MNPVRSLRRKKHSRSEAPSAKPRRHNRVGAGHFALEPLEDRRMLAVLNLDVNLLADVQGTVGTALPTDTVNVGDTFYVEITALDVGGASDGITGLSLDVAWDGAALELLNTPFDPVPFNGILTANFPLNRGGTLSAGQDSIDELAGMAMPNVDPPNNGFAIGNGSAQRFALLRFRADAPVTASAFNVSLGAGGVVFANGDPLDSAAIDPQTITVASATPTFSIDDVTMAEGNSGTREFTFTVSAANLGANPVSVSYATNDGFATAIDNDYVSTSGTLTFTPGLPGASTKTVTVTVNGDTLAEGDETFTVDLSNPSANAAIGDGQGVGTITNDDAAGPASFTISDAQVTEGNSGTTNMQFTVTLFNAPATPATVQYTFAPITASPADDDYFPLNGTLTFTPGTLGATQQFFNVQINGDTKVELDETFQVTLHSPTNADIADGEGIGTITNDDTAIVSVANLSIVEGNSGTTQAMVVVSMSSPAVLPVSVMLATSNGTATAGEDYVALSQLVTIPVNQTQVMVPIAINGDAAIESDETITVTISGATFGGNTDATRATIGAATATVTVTNDDSDPSVAQISIADVSIAEGDSGTSQAMVTVSLSQTVNEDVTVTLNTASGTATIADGDFAAAVNETVTIPAGQTSATVVIAVNGDAKVELDETFTLALSNALVGGVSDPDRVAIQTPTATVTITNDDTTTLSLNDVSQVEGNEDFEFTVTLSKAVDVPLMLTVRSGTTDLFDITIPSGATTHNFTVAVSNSDDNNIVEGERVATITLVDLVAQGRNVTLGDVTGEAIVLDNDTATLSINDVSQEEAVGDFVFTLTLSKPVAVDVFVSVMAPEGSDIITIPALALTQTFTVLFDDNDIVEFDGEFDITITSIDADGLPVTIADGTGVGEILDDDFADITISDVSIVEGNSGNTNLVFTVTLSNPVDADVVLNYATSDGTASAGSDYIAKSGTITFARPVLVTDPFVTSQTITIEIVGDTVIEPNETFTVTLSGLTAEGLENIAVFIMDGTAIGTITDDDTPVPTLSISDGTVVAEGDSGSTNMVFTVTLVNPPAGEVQVNYQTVDGTASSLDLDFADTFGTLVFPQGTTTQTIMVPILGDTLVELDESFTVELFTATGATIGDDEGIGTITDDDAATISIADATAVVEGDSGTVAMTFTVTLSGEVDIDVTVSVNTANGTATGGVDFVAITGQTITFTAGGALTQDITVIVNGDETVELDEVLSVVLSNISAAGRDVTFADDTASGTITDDDALSISIGNATLVEGTGVAPTAFAFPITLSAPAGQEVTVVVNTVDGSATAAVGDYTPLTDFLVTIPAGQTTANVIVEVDADADIEVDEQFGLTITDARIGGATSPSVTIGQANATGTITNDDAESMLSIADVSIAEGTDAGTTTMTFTITMSAAQSEDVTVTVNTSDGTATVADGDYTAVANQTVMIPAGETSATFTVTIARDAKVEADETFTVALSNPLLDGVPEPTLVAIADGTATGTITNDDAATVSIANASVVEGNAGTTTMTFSVTLSAPVDAPVTVTLNSADGTATIADDDYEAVAGATLTFNPGDPLTKTFDVTINGDTAVETNETFALTLSNLDAGGRNVALGTATATGTITNDDGITVSVADATVVEGDSGTANLVFTISLSAAVNAPVSVNVTSADVLATAGVDYQGVNNLPFTIPAGETSVTVTIEVGGDNLVERDETLTLTLSNLQTTAANVTLGDAVATGTITNDDDATISVADVAANEGNSGTTNLVFTVTLSAAVDTDITLSASTANDTATAPSDFTALSGQTVTIPAGATSATVTVSVAGDTTVEANELLDLILSNLQAGGRSVTIADGEAVGTITNDDAATISIAPATLVEGNSGTSSMMFNVTLSAAVDVPVTVTLNTADGTATVANNDYAAVSGGTLTFNPGDPLTKTFAVTINGDTAVETNETFTLTMSNVQAGGRNVSLGTASAQGTITNDDGPATALLSIADATTTEGNTGAKTLAFTVTLSAAVEEDVTVTVNSTNGTATAGQDYTALVNQTVTILAGQTTATVNVTLTGDNTVELDETFTLTLSNPLFDGVSNLARVALDTDNGDNIDNVATGTITNDDVGTLTIANLTQAEGTSATPTAFVLTVTMSNPADRAVTFTVNTANGTATAGTDYTAISNQTVTIAAGQTTAQVTVNVTADSTVESNETFTVAMSNPQFGGAPDTARIALGAASTATVTITDDDGQSSLSGFVFVDADNDGVRDTGEVGVPGVQVTLRRTDVTGTPDVVVLTGNDGSYSFANVTPGTYSIIQAQPAAFIDGADAVGSQGGTLGNDTISAIALAGGVTGTENNFGERGLTPDFVSKRLYLGSTPEAATTLRELNARAAELAGNTALAQSIRSGASTVVNATVSIADATVTEGNTGTTTMTFNVTLSSPSDAPVSVTVNTANGTATIADNDYTAISNQTITFAAGVTTQTVTVTINGDTRGEANETFNVNLSNIQANGRNVTFADASAVGTITNDDTPSISIADQSLVEGSSGTTNMVFTLTMSAPMDVPVTVQATTANGTATAGTDYTALTNQTVTFNAGSTTATLSVPITGDTTSEPNETFTVTLANATATGRTVTIGDGTATGTITNDDGASLSIADRTLVEGNSGTTNMVFTVTLANPPSSGNVTVQFATGGGTATANTDYTTTTGTLTFTPGTTTQTISVPIVGDTTFEPDETFTVTLSNPTNATLSDATATGTITNDDNNALLSIADQTLVEGNSGTTNMVFTVTLANPPATGNVTVQFATTAGNASAGTDYTSTSGTLTFAQGTTTQTISVPIAGDTIPEPNETFTVTLSNPTNASLSDATATGTITNDDGTPPSLAIGDMSLVEGDSGTTNIVFTVTLTNPPSSGDVTVQFGTSNGTATAGSDYTTTTGTLTFSPGTTTQTISVPIAGDTLVEANETFSVTLTNPINATISDASAVGTITNDDAGATLSIADATLVEGDNGATNMQFTVTLADPPGSGNVTVQFATTGNTATADTDYTTATGTLTFTPGTTTQTINVPIVGDATVEADETFTVTLSNATNATISDATATGTITDDDEATVSIADAAAVTEGNSGATNATFTVMLSAAVDTNVTVTVNTANGTATAGTDYTGISGQTLTFTPGGPLTQTVTVAVLGDTADETDETFSVVLSNLSASGRDVTLLDATGVGTITDDDQAAAATLSIADASIAEGTGAGTTTLSFTITLSAVQSQDVTVTAMSAPGSATVTDNDYSLVNQTVTIPAGQTTATVSSTVGRDNKVELDEMFTVTLSNPLLGGAASVSLTLGDATATGTITNDDSATLSVNDAEGEEADGDQTFTITLSAPVDVPVMVNFNDEVSDQTVTIAAGSLTATALAAVDDNTTVQFDLPYTVTLSNVQASGRNVTIADATGEGLILDDDFADVQITNVSLAEGNSGATNFTFTVTLTNPVEANVTMDFATSDGTATSGSDYVAQSGTVSFLPLATSQTITIVVNGDTTVEANETFMVTLSALDAEGLEAAGLEAVAFEGLGSTLAATGTITNDDSGAAAALSIIAFAPTGGGLPGETTLLTSTSSSPATYESLDSTAVDAAFADDNATTLSAGQVARRSSLPTDEAFEETLDWLAV